MPAVPKTLKDEERDAVEIGFYRVWRQEPGDLYEFVVREATAFIEENPGFAGLRPLVEKEFLRLARLER